jgi:hypothetical protein
MKKAALRAATQCGWQTRIVAGILPFESNLSSVSI